MKKLVRNLALLLLPIVLYYCVFLTFERNNYFNLRAETPSGSSIGALRTYERNPQTSIIVGDSRMAHFNMALVQQSAQRPFANLAYGGASLKEELDLLDWCLTNYPDINEVVFGLSFYTLNGNYQYDRFDSLQKSLYNPFSYLTNLSFHIDTLQVVWDFLHGRELYGGDAETQDPATYTYVDFTTPTGEVVTLRQRLAQYLLDTSPYTTNWVPYTEQFERLLAVIDDCAARGIRFVVVLPPMHQSMLDYAVIPYGIEPAMVEMVDRLRHTPALVLDYEITARPALADDMFFDGFHLDSVRGLPVWTEMLFNDINADVDKP